MEILVSWKDSLQVLKPQNLKPFLLVMAKTILDTYRRMATSLSLRGDWVLVGVLIGLILLTNIFRFWNFLRTEAIFLNGLQSFFTFMLCLTLRSSVELKNKDYFYSYFKRFWYLLALTVVLGITPFLAIPFAFIWYIFFLFAAFDTDGSFARVIGALHTSMRMLIYNLPLCAVAYIVQLVVYLILDSLVKCAIGYWGGLTIAAFLYVLFIPIVLALLANIYIKRLHDQPELYFTQPK